MRKNLKVKSKSKFSRKKINNEVGITLIALIITIIVLLILAGVTMNLTLGENGIFRTAEMAGKNYMDAQDRELAEIANFTNALNDILGSTGGSDTDIPEIKDDTLKGNAKPGDYVKYDTGITSVGNNGVVTFRVLYNDDTYGLQIISDKNIEQVTLGGDTWEKARDSYNNLVATLNQKAEYYATSSSYALDGRCVGSVPSIGTDGKFNVKNTENVEPVQLEFTSTVEGANNMKGEDNNFEIDQTALKEANIWTTGEEYWLSSRYLHSISSYCNFRVRYVDTSGELYGNSLCFVRSDGSADGNSYEYGLRPCISLKSDIKIIAGDGETEETAYELGI